MAAMTDSIACFRPGGVCESGKAAVAAKAPAAQARANRRRVRSGGVMTPPCGMNTDYRSGGKTGDERTSELRSDGKLKACPTYCGAAAWKCPGSRSELRSDAQGGALCHTEYPLHAPAGFAII